MTKLKPTLAITKTSFPNHLQRFIEAKALSDEAAARLKSQRNALIDFVEKRGIQDNKGHQWMEAEGVGSAKRERRVSNVFDADFAEEYLKKAKLWLDCSTTITVIDEDAVLAAIYEGKIPAHVAELMYTEKESFYLKVTAS